MQQTLRVRFEDTLQSDLLRAIRRHRRPAEHYNTRERKRAEISRLCRLLFTQLFAPDRMTAYRRVDQLRWPPYRCLTHGDLSPAMQGAGLCFPQSFSPGGIGS